MSELQQRRKAPIVQGQSQFFQAIGCKVVGGSNCPPKFSSRWFKEKLAPVEKDMAGHEKRTKSKAVEDRKYATGTGGDLQNKLTTFGDSAIPVPNVSFSFGDLNQQRADPTSPNAGYNLYKEEGPIETPHDASLNTRYISPGAATAYRTNRNLATNSPTKKS
ncbi:hypothetical protein HUJ04_011268 [Dendroctonus ponderosae]|nr:hypothetical protein HUJ04_011268 [Dendroctonus ponderosae]